MLNVKTSRYDGMDLFGSFKNHKIAYMCIRKLKKQAIKVNIK